MRRLLAPATIVVLPALMAAAALGPGEMLFGSDVVSAYYYQRAAAAAALSEGRLPIWDPQSMCGFPTLANIQTATFYPGTWLFAVVSTGNAWTLTVVLHLALAGLFAYLWLHRGCSRGPGASLAGALIYMLSSIVLARVFAGHLTIVSAYPWVPAVLWRLERLLAGVTRRRTAWLALPIVMILLAGHPQQAFFVGLLVVARVAWTERTWKPIAAVVGSATVALLICAPQLLPTIELTSHSQRGGNAFEFVSEYSMPPENLVTLLAPAYFGDDVTVPYRGRSFLWEACAFVGIGSLVMAGFGRDRLRGFWIAVGVAGVLLALGRYTPIFKVWVAVVPGAGLFRAPGRYLFFLAIAVVPMAAAGYERIRDGDPRRATTWTGALLAAGAAACFFVDGLTVAAGSLVVIAAILLLHGRGLLPAGRCAGALTAFVTVELVLGGSRFLVGTSEDGQRWNAKMVEAMERREPRARLASPLGVKEVGRSGLYGIDHIGGHEPLMLKRYAELINASEGRATDVHLVVSSPERPGPIPRMLGARYWVTPPDTTVPPGWTARVEERGWKLLEDPAAMPRAFVVPEARVIADPAERVRFLTTFDPAALVVLERDPGFRGGPGTAQIVAAGPGRYDVNVDAPEGGFLVLTEAWFPGWAATIDGGAAEIFVANHFVQAVAVPPGNHRVMLSYTPRFLGLGFGLSALGIAAAAACFVVRRR